MPRSTARGWLLGEYRRVVTADVLDLDRVRLEAGVLELRDRTRRLGAVIRLLLALIRALGAHLEHARLPGGGARARLLRAIDRSANVLSLRRALRLLHLSPARYYQWRATEPDELWHVDTTIIELIDGTKVYLHAVIDNFSRRILAWRVTERFEFATTVAVLHEAARRAVSAEDIPTLVADEVYHGRGQKVPEQLEAEKRQARAARLGANRELSCQQCEPPVEAVMEAAVAA